MGKKTDTKEIREADVLKIYCNASVSIMDGWRDVISSRMVANLLKISRYKARKLIKGLVEKELLERSYYGGWDDYSENIFCCHGYRITKKARKTQEFEEAAQKEAKSCSEIFGNGTPESYYKAIMRQH